MSRYCETLGVSPEYFDGKRVVDLGCGSGAWFARAVKGRAGEVWAVEAGWMNRDGEFGRSVGADVADELGDHALAQDFLLDEIELGGEVDVIVSVGALTLAIASAEDEWQPEIRVAVRGYLAKLALGGEMRLGPIPKMLDEADGGAGYVCTARAIEELRAEGFEVTVELYRELPERKLLWERAIVRRVK